MSASSSGKYTRELKLRVLEHYYRAGGDVFGNKQATANKFGVDSKTVHRFLQQPELVKVARRKAARASGRAAATSSAAGSSSSSSNGGDGGSSGAARFKVPLAPGGSPSARPRPQARQTVSISLPDQPDDSLVNQTAAGNLSNIGKLLKIFEVGTQELRDLLLTECELIYECRVCRGLFRSVANLLAHKRRYCCRRFADTRQVFGPGPGQSLAAESDGVLLHPPPLSAAIDALPEVRAAAAAALRAQSALPLPPVRLEPVDGSTAAVYQTVGAGAADGGATMAQRLAEVRQLQTAAQGRTVRLGRDGRIVEGDVSEAEIEAEATEVDDMRHICPHCNTTFSTRKTLSHHIRSLHAATRIYYPCPCCSAAFINMFSVERHLQKVHKKKQDEIESLKEGIKQKIFQRTVNEAQAGETVSTPLPNKVTSFEWKCRQCDRRFLSLPVGLQHVQTSHPLYMPARAGLVRVCRVIQPEPTPPAASTRSSGAPTPTEDEDEAGEDADTDGRLAFNKANLLRRSKSGRELCVLCKKVFAGHTQACGHLRLHSQAEIESYLGQKVLLDRRVALSQHAAEEYELDEMEAPPEEEEQPPEPELSSIASRGFPVEMIPVSHVRKGDFIYRDGEVFVCTLCEDRYEKWLSICAHMTRHKDREISEYVRRFAEDGRLGVPVRETARRRRTEDRDRDREAEEAETLSVDTDIQSGARLLVSCKLWSPRKKSTGDRTSEDDQRLSEEEDLREDEGEEEPASDVSPEDAEVGNVQLTRMMNGQEVDKWEVIRRKGERLRCVFCNKTFMQSSKAEAHLHVDHTFEEIAAFVNKWRFKGVNVVPRSGAEGAGLGQGEDEPPVLERQISDSGAAEPVAHAAAERATKRPASAPPPAVSAAKAAKPDPSSTVPAGTPKLAAIGPNTKILRISRSDLLVEPSTGSWHCLICDSKFHAHVAGSRHMRQHTDEHIRNFIRFRGREFLPQLEQRSKANGSGLPSPVTAQRTVESPAASPKIPELPSRSLAHLRKPEVPTSKVKKQMKKILPLKSGGPVSKQVGVKVMRSAVNFSQSRPVPASSGSQQGRRRKPVPRKRRVLTPRPAAESPTQSSTAAIVETEQEHNPLTPESAKDNRPSDETDASLSQAPRFTKTSWRSPDPQDARLAGSGSESEGEDTVDRSRMLRQAEDLTECLLCGKVFGRYRTACSHLSQHGQEEVRAWKRRVNGQKSWTPTAAGPEPGSPVSDSEGRVTACEEIDIKEEVVEESEAERNERDRGSPEEEEEEVDRVSVSRNRRSSASRRKRSTSASRSVSSTSEPDPGPTPKNVKTTPGRKAPSTQRGSERRRKGSVGTAETEVGVSEPAGPQPSLSEIRQVRKQPVPAVTSDSSASRRGVKVAITGARPGAMGPTKAPVVKPPPPKVRRSPAAGRSAEMKSGEPSSLTALLPVSLAVMSTSDGLAPQTRAVVCLTPCLVPQAPRPLAPKPAGTPLQPPAAVSQQPTPCQSPATQPPETTSRPPSSAVPSPADQQPAVPSSPRPRPPPLVRAPLLQAAPPSPRPAGATTVFVRAPAAGQGHTAKPDPTSAPSAPGGSAAAAPRTYCRKAPVSATQQQSSEPAGPAPSQAQGAPSSEARDAVPPVPRRKSYVTETEEMKIEESLSGGKVASCKPPGSSRRCFIPDWRGRRSVSPQSHPRPGSADRGQPSPADPAEERRRRRHSSGAQPEPSCK